MTPAADRSRRPGLSEFLPVGGLQLLGSRGMLIPAIVFSLLLMRLMWLLRQPNAEALASFVVEFWRSPRSDSSRSTGCAAGTSRSR